MVELDGGLEADAAQHLFELLARRQRILAGYRADVQVEVADLRRQIRTVNVAAAHRADLNLRYDRAASRLIDVALLILRRPFLDRLNRRGASNDHARAF